jgi:hypothetical protein
MRHLAKIARRIHSPSLPTKGAIMYRSSTGQKRSLALQVEALEDRCVPSTAEYVTGLYTSLLHRSPAPTEVAGWVDALNTGAITPAQAALAFTTSSEYATDEIQNDYVIFLGRQPAPAEIAGWLQPLEATGGEKQVEASFLGSNEYFGRQGGNTLAWLNGVYHDVLGRAPDAGGFALWSQKLQAGSPRAAVALAIVDSSEADSQVVSAAYLNLLGRPADASGLARWVAQLQQGLTPSGLAASFASSQEFFQLKAHGVLDAISSPCPSAASPAPADPQPAVDPSIIVTSPTDGTDATDQGSFDGTGAAQEPDGSTCPPSPDNSTFDPGSDNGGSDSGFDDSGSDSGGDGCD